MNNTWIFKDGLTRFEFTSFPYAFRYMWNAIRKGIETGKRLEDMTKTYCILSPVKNNFGESKRYSYLEAMDMAKSQGLINGDGQINNKEFKKKK